MFSGDVRHTWPGRSDVAGEGLAARSPQIAAVPGRGVRARSRISPLTARDGVRTVAAVPDDLRALGWDATLDEAWSALACRPAWAPGRVRRIDRGWSSLLSAPGPGEQPPPPDRVRNLGADVAVGDWVVVSDDGERVEQLLPRRSVFVRRASFEGAHAEAQHVGRQHRRRVPRARAEHAAQPAPAGAGARAGLRQRRHAGDRAHQGRSRRRPVDTAVAAIEHIALDVPVHVVSGRTGAGLDALRAP